MSVVSLKIDGMHCAACERRVNLALAKVEGISAAEVKIGSAEVTYDSARTSPAEMTAAIAKFGFTAEVR